MKVYFQVVYFFEVGEYKHSKEFNSVKEAERAFNNDEFDIDDDTEWVEEGHREYMDSQLWIVDAETHKRIKKVA